jgi:hypothetical protein
VQCEWEFECGGEIGERDERVNGEKRAGFSRPIKGTYADKEERDKLKISIAS